MSEIKLADELSAIAEAMVALLPKFRDGGNIAGLLLPTEYASQFKGLAIEAKSLLDEALGHANDFSMNLIPVINSSSGGFFSGPSHADVTDAAEIVGRAARKIGRAKPKPSPQFQQKNSGYIDESVVASIRSIRNPSWDFTKLLELCRELNVAAQHDCHMSVAVIIRAIVDHVPPLFGCAKFAEVASSYAGSRSFKEHMNILDKSSRKLADGVLHTQIRKVESLLSPAQIDFRAAIGELLNEIVRISKQEFSIRTAP